LTAVAIFLAPGFARAEGADLPIVFNGNACLDDAELLETLNLGDVARVTPPLARVARKRLLNHYHAQGYVLARIWTKIHKGKLYVSIDEGRLDRVIIRGYDSVRTSLVRLSLELPHETYNKPLFEERLAKVKKDLQLQRIKVRIVKSKDVRHEDWQLSDIGFSWLREASGYELHLQVESERGEGPSMGVEMISPYGVVPRASWTRYRAFFEENEDRLNLYLQSGYWIRKSLNGGSYEPAFTHVRGGGRYEYPRLWNLVRFSHDLYTDLSVVQRSDLPLDAYWDNTTHASLNIGFDFFKNFTLFVGGAVEYKYVFSIVKVKDEEFFVDPFAHLRGVFTAGLRYKWAGDELRNDRDSFASLAVSPHLEKISTFYRGEIYGQQFLPFGWHDLIFKVKLLGTLGASPFYDEASLSGDTLRTFYPSSYFIDNAAWLSAEFRVSLWRDIVKLSVYHDLALFGQIEHDPRGLTRKGYGAADEKAEFAWANSFGPGFHWLILDTFQFDIYGAFGFSPSGFAVNPYFSFKKVY